MVRIDENAGTGTLKEQHANTHHAPYLSNLWNGVRFAGMDDAQLKERLTGGVSELIIWGNYNIKEAGVTDEQFYRVLMELYREAEDKWPTLTPKTTEWKKTRMS